MPPPIVGWLVTDKRYASRPQSVAPYTYTEHRLCVVRGLCACAARGAVVVARAWSSRRARGRARATRAPPMAYCALLLVVLSLVLVCANRLADGTECSAVST